MVEPEPPPIINTNTVRRQPPSSTLLARYYNRCGFRSVLFQSILFGWALLCGMYAFLICFLTFPREKSQLEKIEDAYYHREGVDEAAWFFASFLCPGAVWLLIALPLLIAAIATLNRK